MLAKVASRSVGWIAWAQRHMSALPLGKNFLTWLQHWSGAAMCPTCLCGGVGIGFGLAALVGIPLGFDLGRFRFLSGMAAPIIALLKPVSPLAWLPIGLLVFKAANPAAIYVIFICSLWPMIVNTAVGVRQIPQDYLNVARVLNLSEWKVPPRSCSPRCCRT